METNATYMKVLADKDLNLEILSHLKKQSKSFPKGSLCSKRIKGHEYFYHYTYLKEKKTKGKGLERQVYISQKNHLIKESLQKKAFVLEAIKILEKNIDVSAHFLSHYQAFSPHFIIERLASQYKDFDLIPSNINDENTKTSITKSKEIETKNSFHLLFLTHKTPKGLKVRSKSESIIATLLDTYEISYMYEQPLVLGKTTLHPDFTIERKSDKKIFYWEHFGMMSKMDYAQQSKDKIRLLMDHEIFPFESLITTFESEQNPFDGEQIKKIIQNFFL